MTTPSTNGTTTAGDPAVTPSTIWRTLRSIDFALLDHIAYLAQKTAQRSPTRAYYCTPGRRWLAHRVGVSIGTISRHTSRLKELGMLHKAQRRPIAGKWQTNLYTLRGRATWLVARAMQGFHAAPNRVPPKAHKPPSEGELEPRGQHKDALRAMIRSLQARIRGS